MAKLYTEKDLDKFLLLGSSPVLFMPDLGAAVHFQLREGILYKKAVGSSRWSEEPQSAKKIFAYFTDHGMRVRALSPSLFGEDDET